MDRCIGCQYYDRQLAKPTDSRGVQRGQCRRAAPMLHPINAKSYMIEGVWPHVRDDDWCGEWKVAMRRAESRAPEMIASGPLVTGTGASSFAPRPAAMASLQGSGLAMASVPIAPATSSAAMTSSGRGD